MNGRSTIPAALDALVAACTAAAAGVQVIDGQPLQTEADYIAVGFARNPEDSAVMLSESPSDAGLSQGRESYDIVGEVSSWNGDTVQKVARDRVFDLLTVVAGAVKADHRLGGSVARAVFASGDLVQGIANQGAVASVVFTVHVEAFRS